MKKINSKLKKRLIESGKKYITSLTATDKNQINNKMGAYVEKAKFTFTDNKSFLKLFGFKKKLPIATIYLNCLTDFPNIYGETWYKDYFKWTNILLKYIKKNKKVNFILKAHPAEKSYELYFKDIFNIHNYENIKYFENEVSDLNLLLNSKYIITNLGSIAHEALNFDKIVIASKKNFISDFNFSYSYRNKQELIFLIKNLHKLNNKMSIKKILNNKKYLYMYYGHRFTNFSNKLVYQNHLKSVENSLSFNKYVQKNFKNINEEIKTIKKWNNLNSEKNYSVFKLLN